MHEYTIRQADIGPAIAQHDMEGVYGYRRSESLHPVKAGWAAGRHVVISSGFGWHGNTGGMTTVAYLVPAGFVAAVQAAIDMHDLAEAGDLLCRGEAPPTPLHITG